MTKEAIMKAKYINTLILVVVATGTVFASFIGDISRGVEPLQSIFFGFVAAIITIQVLPALVLLVRMTKGLLTRPDRELAEEKQN
jgi:hypothetical protein